MVFLTFLVPTIFRWGRTLYSRHTTLPDLPEEESDREVIIEEVQENVSSHFDVHFIALAWIVEIGLTIACALAATKSQLFGCGFACIQSL